MLTLPTLKEAVGKNYEALATALRGELEESQIEQIYRVIQEMPTIHLEIHVRGQIGKSAEVDRKITQPMDRVTWTEIHAGMEYILVVDLFRLGRRTSSHIYSPHFPKSKDEGWFLTLGDTEKSELLALKRVSYRGNKSSQQIFFTAPKKTGKIWI